MVQASNDQRGLTAGGRSAAQLCPTQSLRTHPVIATWSPTPSCLPVPTALGRAPHQELPGLGSCPPSSTATPSFSAALATQPHLQAEKPKPRDLGAHDVLLAREWHHLLNPSSELPSQSSLD